MNSETYAPPFEFKREGDTIYLVTDGITCVSFDRYSAIQFAEALLEAAR